MDKIIKIIALTFIFNFLFLFVSYSQIGADYGKDVTKTTPYYPPGSQLSKDGFHPPLTKKQERMSRRARRLTLSTKEQNILNRKEREGTDEKDKLSLWENIRYPFIKRKSNKLEQLKAKTNNKSNLPGYMKKTEKYRLTFHEEDILRKAKTDSLSAQEQKTYNKAIKKQKKLEKIKNSYKPQPISDDEKDIWIKANNKKKIFLGIKVRRKKLTAQERKKLPEIRRKEKHNRKIKRKIHNFQVDSAIASGAWLPVSKNKYSLKSLFFKIKHKRPRPSSYARKLRRINRRYRLTKKQKKNYIKSKNGAFLLPDEKLSARKAISKKWRKKLAMKKLLKKEFLKSQTRETRKMMRKTKKKSDALRKRKKTNKFLTRICNLFEKRK